MNAPEQFPMPDSWMAVAGCYIGPPENYQATLDQSCSQPYSTCPCPPQMPKATTAVMPTITMTEREQAVNAANPPAQPFDFVRPLPSIVSTDPVEVTPSCSTFADWVDQNKGLAIGGLVLAGFLIFGGKHHR